MTSFLRDIWTEWRLGLHRSLPLLLRPLASFRAVWLARSALHDVRRLLNELSVEGGTVVETPPAEPLLRSRISAFGDVTVQIDGRAALPAATLAQHQRSVRERLRPIGELSTVLALVHGLVTVLPIMTGLGRAIKEAHGGSCTAAQAWLEVLLPIAAGTFVSALLAVSRRWLVRWALGRWLRRLGT